MFGINPSLEGLYITPSNFFASKEASCSLKIRNTMIKLSYQGLDGNVNFIEIDGKKYNLDQEIFIDNSLLDSKESLEIKLF